MREAMRAREARLTWFLLKPINSPLTVLLCVACLVTVGAGGERGSPGSLVVARVGGSSSSMISGIGVLFLVVRW